MCAMMFKFPANLSKPNDVFADICRQWLVASVYTSACDLEMYPSYYYIREFMMDIL
jgi:hypothetical protein